MKIKSPDIDILAALNEELSSNLNSVEDLSSIRVFNGRGQLFDGLTDIVVECFNKILVIKFYRFREEGEFKSIIESIIKCSQNFSFINDIFIQYRYLSPPKFLAHSLEGELNNELSNHKYIVNENDIKFELYLGNNLNHGIFLDSANVRKYVLNNSKDKKVLNLFSYTCLFSVAAILGGAKKVFNIDNKNSVLETGRRNHLLNNISLGRNVSFFKYNILKSWGRLKKYGPYDLIIIDPPTFQKDGFHMDKDLIKCLKQTAQMLTHEGKILLNINSPHLSRAVVKDAVDQLGLFKIEEFIDPPTQYKELNKDYGLKSLIMTLK